MNNPQWSDDDITSDYEGSIDQSEFTSVNTSCIIHKYKDGRRYQGLLEGRYGMPNDDTEQARECLKHKLYSDYLLDGKHFISPIGDNPQKIADLGTGAGFWPLDVGDSYPSARVIGTDISPIQPPWTPPNVEFRVEDLDDELQPWTRIYANSDLIHFRSVVQTIRHPEQFIQRVYENLKPGGWVECHEIVLPLTFEDGTPATEHPLQRLYDIVDGPFAKRYGWNIYFGVKLPQVLRETGFINVQEKHNHVPIGRWPREAKCREMGMFNQSVLIDWAAAMLVKHEDLGITEEEATILCREILDDMDNPRIHARLNWAIIWAQKPLS